MRPFFDAVHARDEMRAYERSFRLLPWCLCGLALLMALVTHQRVAVWQNERALWANAVREAPTKPRPWVNYGRALELAGDLDGALEQFQHAVPLTIDARRSPAAQRFSLAAAETNIAHVYLRKGAAASALRMLDATLAWYPEWPYGHFNRGTILWAAGACDEGLTEMQRGWAFDATLPTPNVPCGAWDR